MADIQLEMQKTFREEEHVSFVQRGGIELVVGVNESHVQRTLDNVQDLGGSWVDVGRNESSSSGVIYAASASPRVLSAG